MILPILPNVRQLLAPSKRFDWKRCEKKKWREKYKKFISAKNISVHFCKVILVQKAIFLIEVLTLKIEVRCQDNKTEIRRLNRPPVIYSFFNQLLPPFSTYWWKGFSLGLPWFLNNSARLTYLTWRFLGHRPHLYIPLCQWDYPLHSVLSLDKCGMSIFRISLAEISISLTAMSQQLR